MGKANDVTLRAAFPETFTAFLAPLTLFCRGFLDCQRRGPSRIFCLGSNGGRDPGAWPLRIFCRPRPAGHIKKIREHIGKIYVTDTFGCDTVLVNSFGEP